MTRVQIPLGALESACCPAISPGDVMEHPPMSQGNSIRPVHTPGRRLAICALAVPITFNQLDASRAGFTHIFRGGGTDVQ